jgi:hypothetical protein
VVGFLRVDQPVTAHRYRSPWRRNRGLARISRSSRSSRFSRRSRRSSSRSAVVSPSVRWPASRSAWRTHWRTAVSVRSSSLETWPTVLVLRMSSTTYALYSGGKNRRGRGIGMSTSRPTTGGSWPHVPGSPGAGLVVACQSLCSTQSPRKYLASRTRNTVAAIIRHRNSFHAGASSTHDEFIPSAGVHPGSRDVDRQGVQRLGTVVQWATATSPCRKAAPFAVRDASRSAFRFEVPVSGWTRGIGRLCPALG